MQKKAISVIVLFFWIILSFYFGTCSLISIKEIDDYNTSRKVEAISANIDSVAVVYDGIPFKNKTEMKHFVEDEKYAYVSKLFDWSSKIPDFLILLIGTCSFGLLGSLTKIIYDHVFGITLIQNSKYFAFPLLGFLSGFISIGISYLLPNIFLESKSMTNPVGLILFSLFFGFFTKEFLEKIHSKIVK
ncbi:hypothetical protein [Ferruginibacter sp.]